MREPSKTIADLIAEAKAFHIAHIAPFAPETNDEETERLVKTFDNLVAAWQTAPCRTLSDVQTKVSFLLDSRNALNSTCENEGEMERLLQSFMFAKEPNALDLQDCLDVVDDMLGAILIMAKGLEHRHEGNALAAIVEATKRKLGDEVPPDVVIIAGR